MGLCIELILITHTWNQKVQFIFKPMYSFDIVRHIISFCFMEYCMQLVQFLIRRHVLFKLQVVFLLKSGPSKRPNPEHKVCHSTEKTVKYTVQTEPESIECGDRDRSEPVTKMIPQHTGRL